MRAILYRLDEDCKPIHTLGNDPDYRRLTKDYSSFAMLYRYAIKPALKQWDGRVKAEIWNTHSIYKEPDRVQTWNTNIFKRQS